MDIGTGASLAIAGVSAVVWAVRLEGKLNTHAAKDEAIQAATQQTLDDIKEDVTAIRNYLLPSKDRR